MDNFVIKIIEGPRLLSAVADSRVLGSQYDSGAQRLFFVRPEKFIDSELILHFTSGGKAKEPINIGHDNEFVVTGDLTEYTELWLQIAHVSDAGESLEYTDRIKFSLRESVLHPAPAGEPLPQQVRELEKRSFTGAEYSKNHIIFSNAKGEAVRTLPLNIPGGELPDNNYMIDFPERIFVSKGQTAEVYYENLMAGMPAKRHCIIKSARGKALSRKWSFTADGDVGTYPCSFQVFDNTGNIVLTKDFTLESLAPDNSPPEPQVLLCIGDSLTNQTFTRVGTRGYLNTLSNVDYGQDTFIFAGTQGTSPYRHEGRTGAKAEDYALNSKGSSPFWDTLTDSLSFAAYTARTGITPDMVHILLGTNEISGNTSAEDYIIHMRRLVNGISLDWPKAQIYISIPPCPGTQDAFGNRGENEALKDVFTCEVSALRLAETILSEFKDDENVFINPAFYLFDRSYNYPSSEVPANPYSNRTEAQQTDPLHPNDGGYKQLWNSFYCLWQKHHRKSGSLGTEVINLIQSPGFNNISQSYWVRGSYSSLSGASNGGEYTATVTASSAISYAYLQQSVSLNPSHQYYFRSTMALGGGHVPSNISLQLRLTNQQIASAAFLGGTQTISCITAPSSESVNFQMRFQFDSAAIPGTEFKWTEPMLIDLTACYGDNLPSKEYLDSLDFFSGSVTAL